MDSISVIMPNFNRAHRIAESVGSIQDQTHKDWRLIMVDDGSTDSSEEVIKSMGDSRISFHPKPPEGLPPLARNFGLQFVETDWVIYLDSDDRLRSNALESVLNSVNGQPDVMFGIGRVQRDMELVEKGRVLDKRVNSSLNPGRLTIKQLCANYIGVLSPNGIFHRKTAIDDGLLWDPSGYPMEDWEIIIQLGKMYPKGFLFVPEVIAEYQMQLGGDALASNSGYLEWADCFERIYAKHKDDPLLADQDWYPRMPDRYRDLEKQYQKGSIPSFDRYYFSQG